MVIPIGSEDWRDDDTEALLAAIVSLDDTDDAAAFLRDLCTHRELAEMSARWAVVRQLAAGLPYREIHANTGASTATITRINQWLQHGTGGYRRMLERLGIDLVEQP